MSTKVNPMMGAVGSALMGAPPPTMPTAAASAPSNAAPAGNRISGWKAFFRQIQSDPNMRMALLQTGLGLLETPDWGKGPGDVASQAVNRGVSTLELLRERDFRRGEREEDRSYGRSRDVVRDTQEEQKIGLQRGTQEIYRGEVESQQTKRAADAAREEKLLPGDIAYRGAMTEQAQAGAAENRAQAALAGRTDPNLRGGAGGAGLGGFDVQALEALTQEKIAAGADPTQARAEAAREIQTAKKGSQRDQFVKAVQDEMKLMSEQMDPFGVEPKTQEQLQQLMQTAQTNVLARMKTGQAVADTAPREKWVGKTVPVQAPGGPVNVTITNVVNGQAEVRLPDGTVKIVPLERLEAEYGQKIPPGGRQR